MRSKHWYLQVFIEALIFYSIAMHFIELEFADSAHPAGFFLWSERLIVTVFTIEYVSRWIASRSIYFPFRMMAIIDLLAILPFYLGFLVDLRMLRLVRALRMLRMFKLYRYSNAFQNIRNAFHRVRYEFSVTGFAVLTLACFSSVAIYELERERQPQVFAKMSDALWYVVVTLTTVGYGDKVPMTAGGKVVAVCTMVVGLGLFGTFVSLIGSAFLEELRRSGKPNEKGSADLVPDAAVPSWLQSITYTSFDANRILEAIKQGELNGGGRAVHLETIRLLEVACCSMLNSPHAAPLAPINLREVMSCDQPVPAKSSGSVDA